MELTVPLFAQLHEAGVREITLTEEAADKLCNALKDKLVQGSVYNGPITGIIGEVMGVGIYCAGR